MVRSEDPTYERCHTYVDPFTCVFTVFARFIPPRRVSPRRCPFLTEEALTPWTGRLGRSKPCPLQDNACIALQRALPSSSLLCTTSHYESNTNVMCLTIAILVRMLGFTSPRSTNFRKRGIGRPRQSSVRLCIAIGISENRRSPRGGGVAFGRRGYKYSLPYPLTSRYPPHLVRLTRPHKK